MSDPEDKYDKHRIKYKNGYIPPIPPETEMDGVQWILRSRGTEVFVSFLDDAGNLKRGFSIPKIALLGISKWLVQNDPRLQKKRTNENDNESS